MPYGYAYIYINTEQGPNKAARQSSQSRHDAPGDSPGLNHGNSAGFRRRGIHGRRSHTHSELGFVEKQMDRYHGDKRCDDGENIGPKYIDIDRVYMKKLAAVDFNVGRCVSKRSKHEQIEAAYDKAESQGSDDNVHRRSFLHLIDDAHLQEHSHKEANHHYYCSGRYEAYIQPLLQMVPEKSAETDDCALSIVYGV